MYTFATDTMPFSVLLIDDHDVFRTGLKHYLREQPLLSVAYEATNGAEGLACIRTSEVEVIVLDINMPVMDGYEVVKTLREENQEVNIVVLSSYFHTTSIYRMLALGVNAYLTKEDDLDEVSETVVAAAQGHFGFISPFAKALLRHESPVDKEFSTLSAIEAGVLQRIAMGYPNRQIAKELGLTLQQVSKQEQQLLGITKASNRLQLVEWAWVYNG